MYHSITFGDKNSWDDWHLIPASRPIIVPPQPNSSIITIPGTNGAIDLSEALTGYPTFQNRSGSISFYVDHDQWPDWVTTYTDIMTYLHGKSMKIYLEDDPLFYYEGRVVVSGYNPGQSYSQITLQYNVGPYKKEIHQTQKTFDVEDEYSLSLISLPEPITPDIFVTFPEAEEGEDPPTMTVAHTYDSKTTTYDLDPGENHLPRLIFREGVNELIFTGTGNVVLTYRGGTF